MGGFLKTAFVLAGGGSFGAVQVGMLRELLAQGVTPDLIVGSSVGAITGAYLAASATLENVERLARIWRRLRRRDVFPFSLRSLAALFGRRSYMVDSHGIRSLLQEHLSYRSIEEASVPLHVVATDLHGGAIVRLSKGPVIDAVLASCAARLVVLPTGFACALERPPASAIGATLHAINLLIAHQLVADLEHYGGQTEIVTVPPLCPLALSPYDFSRADELMERASTQTRRWLERGGMQKQRIPGALRPHED